MGGSVDSFDTYTCPPPLICSLQAPRGLLAVAGLLTYVVWKGFRDRSARGLSGRVIGSQEWVRTDESRLEQATVRGRSFLRSRQREP